MEQLVSIEFVIDEYKKLTLAKALKPDMRTHCSIEWGLWLATGQEVNWPRLLRTDYGAVWIDGMITVKLQMLFKAQGDHYRQLMKENQQHSDLVVSELEEKIALLTDNYEETKAYAESADMDLARWKKGVRELQDGNSRLPKAVTSFLNSMVDGTSDDEARMPYDATLELETDT